MLGVSACFLQDQIDAVDKLALLLIRQVVGVGSRFDKTLEAVRECSVATRSDAADGGVEMLDRSRVEDADGVVVDAAALSHWPCLNRRRRLPDLVPRHQAWEADRLLDHARYEVRLPR